MIIVYGIKNCNTVKKALNFLQENDIVYTFHDYKKSSISRKKLEEWCTQTGFEKLLNRKGTTWRKLDETQQSAIANEAKAIELMIEKTSVIKRPLVEKNGKVIALGFDEEEYKKALNIR